MVVTLQALRGLRDSLDVDVLNSKRIFRTLTDNLSRIDRRRLRPEAITELEHTARTNAQVQLRQYMADSAVWARADQLRAAGSGWSSASYLSRAAVQAGRTVDGATRGLYLSSLAARMSAADLSAASEDAIVNKDWPLLGLLRLECNGRLQSGTVSEADQPTLKGILLDEPVIDEVREGQDILAEVNTIEESLRQVHKALDGDEISAHALTLDTPQYQERLKMLQASGPANLPPAAA